MNFAVKKTRTCPCPALWARITHQCVSVTCKLQLILMGRPRLFDGCTVPGCARPHAARSYCQSHYVLILVRGGHVVACRICGQSWVAPKASSTDGTHAFCLIAEACPELAGDRYR
jgi:hypothetical protein